MQKINYAAIAAFTIFSVAMPAWAASIDNQFKVSVSLSSQCKAVSSGTKTLDFGTYTAFQADPITSAGITIQFECTRGFAPSSVDFDVVNGTAIGGGVLAGLNYDLEASAAVVTAGTSATSAAASIGTADIRTYTVTGTIAADQAGAGTTATAPASHTRTLIVTY